MRRSPFQLVRVGVVVSRGRITPTAITAAVVHVRNDVDRLSDARALTSASYCCHITVPGSARKFVAETVPGDPSQLP